VHQENSTASSPVTTREQPSDDSYVSRSTSVPGSALHRAAETCARYGFRAWRPPRPAFVRGLRCSPTPEPLHCRCRSGKCMTCMSKSRRRTDWPYRRPGLHLKGIPDLIVTCRAARAPMPTTLIRPPRAGCRQPIVCWGMLRPACRSFRGWYTRKVHQLAGCDMPRGNKWRSAQSRAGAESRQRKARRDKQS